MTRTYIMNMALQGKATFTSGIYEPLNMSLEENFSTRFPLLPVIYKESKEEDPIKIIILQADNADAEYNTDLFLEEIENLNIKADTKVHVLKEIKTGSEYARMIIAILKDIDEDSTISMDVTFGTKPESFLIYYASMIAQTSKRDVELEGIYYGQIVRENRIETGRYLHRIDMMKSLLDMTISMKELGYSNIEDIITHLFTEE